MNNTNYNNNSKIESFENLDNSLNDDKPLNTYEFDNFNNSLNYGINSPILGLNECDSLNPFIDFKEFDENENISNYNNMYSLKNELFNDIKNYNEEKEEKKEENFGNIGKNKSTEENSLTNNLILEGNSKKYANTSNMGRKRKNDIFNEPKAHNKESEDNMRIKFKRLFINNLILFINYLIGESQNIKLKDLKLKKIESSYTKTTKKDKNLQMLNLTVGEFLSKEITKKYKKYSKDYNIKIIKLIYEENEERIISILNRSIRDMMRIFCKDRVKKNIFKKYKRLKDYIKEIFINKKKEKESYIQKFIYVGKNYEEIYNEIDGRKEEKDI